MSNPQSSSIWIVVNPCILVDSQTYEFPGEHCHRSSNIPIINKQFSQKSRLKWPYGSIWLVLYPTISSYIPIYLVADIRISHQKKTFFPLVLPQRDSHLRLMSRIFPKSAEEGFWAPSKPRSISCSWPWKVFWVDTQSASGTAPPSFCGL
jgi:hypothetical protein